MNEPNSNVSPLEPGGDNPSDGDRQLEILKLIYDRISDLIFLVEVDSEGRYRYLSVNRPFLEMRALKGGNILNQCVDEVLEESSAKFTLEKFREAGQQDMPIQYEELEGLPVPLETTLTPIFNEGGVCTHLLGVSTNIAERKKMDKEIIRLERLHALEEMARGVAHNFNNVLVGVMGYAQIIEMQSKDQKAIENANKIVEHALRAKELVQRLRFSVRQEADYERQPVSSLNTIVQEAIKATRPKWKDDAEARGINIEVIAHLSEVPTIEGNPVELHHILVHLIVNAVDAMKRDGVINVSLRTRENHVALQVRDEGIGMDEEIQKRIFDPFFTTKQDVGSGLGLSMVYRTVTEWGGRIEIDSQPEKGTSLTVLLPIANEDRAEDRETNGACEGRILIIDDERSVGDVLAIALQGFQVDIESTGEDALEGFKPDQYDVALVDLSLPGMPGDVVASKLKETDSRIVTVLLTGWDLEENDPRIGAFDFHLKKPYKLSEIQEMVICAIARRNEGE